MKYHVTPIHDHWIFRRGDIYLADLGPGKGSKQGGIRPVVNFQNNTANLYSTTFTELPITSQIKRLDLPCHVFIGREGKLKKDSMVMCEQIDTINKRDVIGYIGRLSRETMKKLDDATDEQLGCFVPRELEAP